MKVLKVAFVAAFSFLGGPAVEEAAAVSEIIHVRDDVSGGDCTQVGVWNPQTRTCTLTSDFGGRFIIESDNVTLDGDGHMVTGTGPTDPAQFRPGPEGGGDAIYVSGRSGVTIRNIKFSRFDYSVNLENSDGVTVTGITSSYAGLAGISLSGASNSVIKGNTIINPGLNTGICVGYSSRDNIFTGNDISGAERGIYLHTYCSGNSIAGNYIYGNSWGLTLFEFDTDNILENNYVGGNALGVFVHGGSDSAVVRDNTIEANGTGIRVEDVTGASVHHNNFLGNTTQAVDFGGGVNQFQAVLPGGGNFWSDYDSPAEGCHDVNADGFCDTPYLFGGGRDAAPWLEREGWQDERPRLVLERPAPFWDSYAEYRARLLSITWTIDNLGDVAAGNVTIFASPSTNGVTLQTPLPVTIGSTTEGHPASGTLKYLVPGGVNAFTTILKLSVTDPGGGIHYYPDADLQTT